MLTLPTRPAKIGGSINTRTEKHGDDDVAALDIPLEFLLEPDELCAILKTEDAAARLFTGAFNHELTITSETWGSQGEIELGGAE